MMRLLRMFWCWLTGGHHLNEIDFRIYDCWICSKCLEDTRPPLKLCQVSAPFGQFGSRFVCNQPLPCKFHNNGGGRHP